MSSSELPGYSNAIGFSLTTHKSRSKPSQAKAALSIMGCCQSSFLSETHPETHHQNSSGSAPPPLHHQQPRPSAAGAAASAAPGGGVPAFAEFSFADLKAATNNFSSEFIVSESGEKAPNLVYKGRLKNHQWIAVKKFTKLAWPDPKQFAVYLPLFILSQLLVLGFFF